MINVYVSLFFSFFRFFPSHKSFPTSEVFYRISMPEGKKGKKGKKGKTENRRIETIAKFDLLFCQFFDLLLSSQKIKKQYKNKIF